MPRYRIGKKGRPGSRLMKFGSEKELKKFVKKHRFTAYTEKGKKKIL